MKYTYKLIVHQLDDDEKSENKYQILSKKV